MRIIVTILTFLFTINYLRGQEPFNPYLNSSINAANISLDPLASTGFTWYNRPQLAGYSGEYEITLGRHPWRFWLPGFTTTPVHMSYSMEVVSFPFTPLCAFGPIGCAGTVGRPFYMPADPYDPINNKWGNITNHFLNLDWDNSDDQTLASYAFQSSVPMSTLPADVSLPHSIIKHTIYLHCGAQTNSPSYPPVLYSQSWVYDNTRGRMKYYPFCQNQPSGCSMIEWDLIFAPEVISYVGQPYNESNNANFLLNGTLNYSPYSELQNLPVCSTAGTLNLGVPSLASTFYNGSIYNHPYSPPYALLSSPLWQFRGQAIAGFETDFNNPPQPQLIPLQNGIEHSYTIDQSISLTDISVTDRTIYHPSDVMVTATDLRFPSHYTFKTIRAVYPTPAEVAADDIPLYGGPYSDPRNVPVRTDLRSEDPAFPQDPTVADHSRWASIYRLQQDGKITIEPCVKVIDAAFILNAGSALKFENFNTQTGYSENPMLSRIVIERNGGWFIRQYDNSLPGSTLFLQNKSELPDAPNAYIVDEKIIAGENVDISQTPGPYLASTGSQLILLAKNYVKLEPGFHCSYGSEVKIGIDPFMSIPSCPPPLSGNNNRYSNTLIETAPEFKTKVLITPNPVVSGAYLSLLGIHPDAILENVSIYDGSGRFLFQKDQINLPQLWLNFENFEDGFYFVKTTTNYGGEVVKIIVNKVP